MKKWDFYGLMKVLSVLLETVSKNDLAWFKASQSLKNGFMALETHSPISIYVHMDYI